MSIFGNIMDETSWYLAQLKPNAHRIAERNLRRQGFETFLPLLEVTRRKSTTFVNELSPLFPGYMFVGFKPNVMPWSKINSTQGVSRIVAIRGRPTIVPAELISELKGRCDTNGRLIPIPNISIGAKVKINSGPFTQFVGTVEGMSSEKRVWVLLELMGRRSKVIISTNELS